MVGFNAISEMISSTIITAAVGTALSKSTSDSGSPDCKTRYCCIKV